MTTDAYSAMVWAGDIATAVDRADPEADLQGVRAWHDASGRSRIRVLFGEQRIVAPTPPAKRP